MPKIEIVMIDLMYVYISNECNFCFSVSPGYTSIGRAHSRPGRNGKLLYGGKYGCENCPVLLAALRNLVLVPT